MAFFRLLFYQIEPTRKLFIKILSDVANVMMNSRGDLPVDFWNAADRYDVE